jgi:hypothetical protein
MGGKVEKNNRGEWGDLNFSFFMGNANQASQSSQRER